MARTCIALVAWVLLVSSASAQTRTLTIDDLYDPQKKIDFSGGAPSGLTWISDTHYIWPKAAGRDVVEWTKVDAASGTSEPLFDAAKMRAAFDALPGLRAEDVTRLPNQRSLEFNAARNAVAVSIAADLYVYQFGQDRAVRLTFDPYEEEEFSFSPDGRQIAFVRRNNLYVVNVEQQRQERQLTTSGADQILNGKLDWLYQEEIYGRGNFRGYWWSPDSANIAFLHLDEHPVPEFTVVDHIPARQVVERWEYPKAGDPNPRVKLGVVRAVGDHVQWVDLTKYDPIDFLIVNVSWTPDGRQVVYAVQNREQYWLDLNVAPTDGENSKTLLRETTKAWVNENGPPTWLKDGSFLWISERTGWRHVYRYKADGSLAGPVTHGDWDVRTLHGVDESGGWIYFSGTERSHIGSDAYRITLDGTGLTCLTQRAGMHRVNFSPAFASFIDSWSDANTPPQVRIHKADGTQVRLIHEGRVPQLTGFTLSPPEFLQVKTRDGFVMEAMLIKPPDFNPSRKYPVMQFTYAGPGAQSVTNGWGSTMRMYHQLLAQRGIVVWVCDNRSASGKGARSAWTSYKNFGEQELRDIEDGLAWLRKQHWVDASRIGIDGWSFGGFMVTYALTHSQSFTAGIAGGSVTDWSLYDTIYTERYMLMPQNNPEGYKKSSALAAAKDLHGNLLLIHGVIDENVHMQNTLKFAYELQKAGKPFRLMVYERSRHGVTDPDLAKHMRQMMLDFTLEHLAKPAPRAVTDGR